LLALLILTALKGGVLDPTANKRDYARVSADLKKALKINPNHADARVCREQLRKEGHCLIFLKCENRKAFRQGWLSTACRDARLGCAPQNACG
jgi:hypothetical protein